MKSQLKRKVGCQISCLKSKLIFKLKKINRKTSKIIYFT